MMEVELEVRDELVDVDSTEDEVDDVAGASWKVDFVVTSCCTVVDVIAGGVSWECCWTGGDGVGVGVGV
jgi:hypothetical protein